MGVRGSGAMQPVLNWGQNWKSKAVTTRDKLSWLAHFLVCFFSVEPVFNYCILTVTQRSFSEKCKMQKFTLDLMYRDYFMWRANLCLIYWRSWAAVNYALLNCFCSVLIVLYSSSASRFTHYGKPVLLTSIYQNEWTYLRVAKGR